MLVIKTIFAMVSLLVFTCSFAGSALVEEPRSRNFTVGAELLYLQPTTTNLLYAEGVSPSSSPQSSQEFTVKPIYKPAVRVFGNYYFDEQIDIGVSWTHLRNTQSTNVNANQLSDDRLLIIPTPGSGLASYDNVRGEASLKLDTVNVEWGYTFIPSNTNFTNRIHLGLQFLNLDNHISSLGTIENNTGLGDLRTRSKFTGLGLRVGSNGEYRLGYGFSFTGEIAASLLYGQNTWEQNTTFIPPFGIEPSTSHARDATRDIVPSIEGRVGLKYATKYLAIEGGYQIAGFINSTRDSTREYHNFGYQGPYLGARWVS